MRNKAGRKPLFSRPSVRHDEMSTIPHEIPARLLLDDPCHSIADCNQPVDDLDLHAAARRVSMPLQCRCNVAATLCGPLGRIALGPLLISQCLFLLHWSFITLVRPAATPWQRQRLLKRRPWRLYHDASAISLYFSPSTGSEIEPAHQLSVRHPRRVEYDGKYFDRS